MKERNIKQKIQGNVKQKVSMGKRVLAIFLVLISGIYLWDNVILLKATEGKVNPAMSTAEADDENVTMVEAENTTGMSTGLENAQIEMDKKAYVLDYDARTYQIDLTASSLKTEMTTSQPVDVVLAVDKSGSMKFPSKLEAIRENFVINQDNLSQLENEIAPPYYAISDETGAATVYRIYKNNGIWYYIDSSYDTNEKGNIGIEWDRTILRGDNKLSYTLYRAANDKNRLYYVKDATTTFLKNLKEKSPKSNYGVVTFAKENEKLTGDVLKSMSMVDGTIQAIENIETKGETNQEAALKDARDILNRSRSKNSKYVILITDGCPNATGVTADSIKEEANKLKKQGITLMTVGLSLGNIDSARELMQNIASKDKEGNKYAFEAENGEDLMSVVNQLFWTITNQTPITNAVVLDTIDPRFEIVSKETGQSLKNGDLVDGGLVRVDASGNYVIQWSNQTIEAKGKTAGWQKSIVIKVKDDFMGGNVIPTNTSESYIVFDNKKHPFQKPSVNVKLLDLSQMDMEKTIWRGEAVTPKELLLSFGEELQTKAGIDLSKSGLTEKQIKQLINQPENKVAVDYSYEETNDIVGTFYYQVKQISQAGSFETHEVWEPVGKNREQYQIVISYEPNTNRGEANSQNPGNKVSNKINLENNYWIHVREILLKIMKQDGSVQGKTIRLSGATFELQMKNGYGNYKTIYRNGQSYTLTTDENGIATFDAIRPGGYRLVETKAPNGYQKLAKAVELKVQEPEDNEETQYTQNITILNQKLLELPETGGNGIMWFTLGGAAVLAASLIVLYQMRKRH